jgi:hypothetical protein
MKHWFESKTMTTTSFGQVIVIGARPILSPTGLTVRNYHEPEVRRFTGNDRSGRPVTLVLYAWLRIQAGMEPADAYREATARATGAKKRIDLSDLIAVAQPEPAE